MRCLSDCLTTARIFAGMEVVWCHFLDLNSAGRNSLSSASRLLPAFKRFWRGIPDYPWFFGTNGAFTTYGLTATGQWDEAKDHLWDLPRVSIAVNRTTGKVLHEIVTDGLIYFGTVAQPGEFLATEPVGTAGLGLGDKVYRRQFAAEDPKASLALFEKRLRPSGHC
jgi:hypothetical protein